MRLFRPTQTILLLFAFLLAALPVTSEPVRVGHVQAELVSEAATIQPGQPFWVGLQLTLDPEWHVYWKNPGDAGLAPYILWNLAEGFSTSSISWPTPEKLSVGPLANYAYSHQVLLPVLVTPPADLKPGESVTLEASAGWLVCKEECVPGEADLALQLPITEQPELSPLWTERFAAMRRSLPKAILGWRPAVVFADNQWQIDVQAPAGLNGDISQVEFFPEKKAIIDHAAEQKTKATRNGYQLLIPKSQYLSNTPDSVTGLIVFTTDGDPTRQAYQFTSPVTDNRAATAAATTGSGLSIWKALLFAFLGGMILNLMPCVLPVLSLKILGFVNHARSEHTKPIYHGAIFAAGVLVSFWALAGVLLFLQAGGQQLGWGFQLQSPVFLVCIAAFIFLFGLSLLGVFEIGTSLTAAGSTAARKSGLTGSFFNGVMATVVATPCTAPFMGSALGFSLAQPGWVALLVFTFLGLGMAAPYLVLSASPRLLRFVPKPGAWMETLKQVMGFLLLATVIWLLWVLSIQVSIGGLIFMLIALLVLGVGAWVLGRWGHFAARTSVRRLAYMVASACIIGGLAIGIAGAELGGPAPMAQKVSAGDISWEPFSPQRVDELRREGRPVFIDFTAAWCLSCQVNERVALETEDVQKRFADLGIVALKADWTSRDQTIAAALAQFGRNSVPLYVLYDGISDTPYLLPEILTPGIVLEALNKLDGPRGLSSPAVPAT